MRIKIDLPGVGKTEDDVVEVAGLGAFQNGRTYKLPQARVDAWQQLHLDSNGNPEVTLENAIFVPGITVLSDSKEA